MNKAELVQHIAGSHKITKQLATDVLEGLLAVMTKSIQKGETITLIGFGSFGVKHRAARSGRNPQTGEALKIKAAVVPYFRAGKELKDAASKAKVAKKDKK